MEMKGITEILAFCIFWPIQTEEKVKKNLKKPKSKQTRTSLMKGEKEIAGNIMLGWLFCILKNLIAFKFHTWFLVPCINFNSNYF